MLKFGEGWVKSQMENFWEELVGYRPTLRERLAGQDPPSTKGQTVDLEYAREFIPYSDLNAGRLIRMHIEGRLTYTGSDKSGRWYFWNGVFHEPVEIETPGAFIVHAFIDELNVAHAFVDDAIQAEIAVLVAAGGNRSQLEKQFAMKWKKHKDYQEKLHGTGGSNALTSMLRTLCTKPMGFFDEDQRWLVCENGVIDLEGFRRDKCIRDEARGINHFHDHDARRPVARSIACEWNPKAKAPVWESFLETSQPDPELREFMQRLVGAAFLGESKVKAIPNLVGPKDCGKSVFVTTLDRLAGGYGVQPSPVALMKIRGGQNWEQESLRGKRFVGVTEPSPSDILDESFCKQVTGGDIVHTRAMYVNSSPWVAQCVMFIASNHNVKLNTQDQAFLDRMCYIKFPHQFFDASEAPDDEIHIKDPDLERKLETESEGIFNWVIWGMWKFLTQGIGKPDSVKRHANAVAVESSSALSWVREKVEEGLLFEAENLSDYPLSHYALIGKLFPLYSMDMMQDGERNILGKHTFSKHLQSYYGEKVESGGARIPRLVGTGYWSHIHVPGSQVHGSV